MDHITSLIVRGYELDSFGHVNNAVYFNYCEWARWKSFADFGWQTDMDKNQLFPIVTEQKMKYIRELKNYDKIDVLSSYSIKGIRLLCQHRILKDDVLHAKCNVTMVILDINREFSEIPNKIRKVIQNEATK